MKTIDWDARKAELQEIADWAKSKKATYDCVIGVSGGKDSTFQAIYARDKLGLRPLLVNSEPEGITEAGKHNIENLINMGFDCIKLRPNPQVMKKLCKNAFYKYGNPVKPTEYSLWASAYIIADKFDIPLIIQGENAALTLGTANTNQSLDGNAFSVVDLDTLNGCNAIDLVLDDVELQELNMFQFPDMESLRSKKTKAVFLQYYAKEWNFVQNAIFSLARGLKEREAEDLHDIGTYRRWAQIDGDMVLVNQMLKYLKFGFGFATDEACYDIRLGIISREDAKWLVNEYDGKCGEQYIRKFCDYIGISIDEFWDVTDKYVNKDLFRKDLVTGRWVAKFTVGQDFDGN
jgi:N-acetyl sugar amidotransferase